MIEGCTQNDQPRNVLYEITTSLNTIPYFKSQPLNYSIKYYQNFTFKLPEFTDNEMNSPIVLELFIDNVSYDSNYTGFIKFDKN